VRYSWFHLLLGLLGSLLVLFVLAPLIRLVSTMPGADYAAALQDRELWTSIGLTLRAAAWATVLCALSGIPLAYLLARYRFVGRSLIQGIVDLPVMVPHSAAGIALLGVIGRHSFLQQVAKPLHINFVGEQAGIVLAMSFVALPFLVSNARDGFAAVPSRLENVARSLGASPARVFLTIALPLAWRSIVSGLVLMWGRGISEFGAIVIIAYHPMTTPVLVYQRFSDYGLAASRSAAVALILVCAAAFILLRLIGSTAREARE
jgi:molybdate/tungstate transport system permease protein